jgi:serine/threonine protein kinase
VDWWALGILIYEVQQIYLIQYKKEPPLKFESQIQMIVGHPPFFDDDPFKLYEKILECKLRFPPHFDALAKDLVKHLLVPDLSQRYGNLKAGSEDIKTHKWFYGVDWNKLVSLEIPAPYVPKIKNEDDTSCVSNLNS